MVREFITHRKNGLLTSFFDPPALARSVVDVLGNKSLDRVLRLGARAYAEKNLSMAVYLKTFCVRIEQLTGQALSPPSPSRIPAAARARAGKLDRVTFASRARRAAASL